jgi:hypothetical protein
MKNTVKDLIEALQKLPADAVIQIQKESQIGFYPSREWENFDIDNDVFFYDKKNIVKLGDIT